MENFDQAMAASTTATHSQGSAFRENEAYLNSYEAKINRVKNAWTETAISMNEGFVGDALVGFTSFATGSINVLTSLIDKVGLLPLVLGTATIAFSAFKHSMTMDNGKAIYEFFKNLPIQIAQSGTSAKEASNEMGLFSKATTVATGAVSTLRVRLASLGTFLLGAALPIAGFMALGAAISYVTGKIAENTQRREEWKRLNDQSISSLNDESEKVKELAKEYEDLSKIDRNLEQEQRYVELQNELGAILPTIVEGEDEKGNKIIANTGIVNEHIEALEKQIEYERELSRMSAQPNIEVNKNNIIEARQEIERLQDEIAKYQERQVKAASSGDFDKAEQIGIWISGWMADIADLNEEIVGYTNSIVESYASIASEQENLTVQEATWIGQLASETEMTLVQTRNLSNEVANLKATLGDGFSFEGLNFDQFNQVNEIAQQVQNGAKDWSAYAQSLQSVGVESDKVTQILGYLRNTEKDLIDSANAHGASVKSHKPIFDELGNVINWVSKEFDDATGSIEDNADAVDELQKSYDDAISSIKSLNGVINELNEGHGVSAETVSMLMEKYPHLLKYLNDETALRDAISKAISQEEQVAIDALSNKLLAEEKYLNEVLKGNNELYKWLIDTYGVDLKNFKNLAQAKAQVENQLINEMSRKWGKFYNAQAQSLTEMGRAFTNMDVSGMGVMEREMYEITRGQLSREIAGFRNQMGEVASRFNSIVADQIGVNFGSIGLSAPKASRGSKGGRGRSSSKKETDAAKAAEEAQRRVLEVVLAQIEAYKRKVDALNDDIAHEEYYASKYEETSHQYRQRQKNIAQLKKQQADYHKQTISYIEGQLKSNKKLNTEQRRELQKTLIQTRQTYYSTLSDVDSINKEILKSYQTIADKVVEVYKESYEKQKQIALEANENELKILQDAHSKKIKMLDEELSAYEKLIQAKIDSMDKEKDNADYAETLAEKQKERLEIQRQIQILSLSDDMSDRKKVRDLEEELRKKEKEINDFVSERERQLRKESLQDQLNDKREQIEAEKELENSHFEDQKHQLEMDRKIIERHYEDLLNDERKFAQIREQIMNDNTKNLTKTLKQFSKDIKSNMNIIGKSISNNLLDKLSEAQKLLSGIKFSSGGSVVSTPGGLPSFDTGGFTGKFKGGMISVLHEEELVLNKKDTKNLMKYNNMVNKLIPQIPSLGKLNTNDSGTKAINFNPSFQYLIQGQFDEGLARKYTNHTLKEIKNEFQSLGVRFPR